MTRTVAALAASLALAAPVAASAASAPPDPLIAPAVAKVAQRTTVPVYAPSYLPVPRVKGHPLVVTSGARARGWDIELAYAPHCGGATACFAGSLSGRRTKRHVGRFDGRAVKLHRGITGRFRGLSCGASCSEPSITWKARGVIYRFQLDVGSRRGHSDLSKFRRIANSAIDAGPR